MIALALEKHRLHERIALNLIRITGTSGNGIILGFTLATGILSMWISNTATALMMLPIALSVIDLLRQPQSESGTEMSKNEKYFALGSHAEHWVFRQHWRYGNHYWNTSECSVCWFYARVLPTRSRIRKMDVGRDSCFLINLILSLFLLSREYCIPII